MVDGTWIASKTIHELFPHTDRTEHRGWAWESKREAMPVWNAVKQAIQQDRPMPEWAKTALQAGWKPPKNWKA